MKRFNKINNTGLACLLLALSLTLYACNASQKSTDAKTTQIQQKKQGLTSEQLAKKYLDTYLLQRDIAGAYDYISESDRKLKSREVFVKEKISPEWEETFKQVNTYKIIASKINAETATFTVEMYTPDLRKVFQDILRNPSVQTISSEDKGKRDTLIEAKIKEFQSDLKSLPMTTIKHDFNLIKEQGVWGIHFNWSAESPVGQVNPSPSD